MYRQLVTANILVDVFRKPFTFRDAVVVGNTLIVLTALAYVIYRVVLSKREQKTPPNLKPFLPDEELEGRHLERILGMALLFVAMAAIAMTAYALFEPWRQAQANNGFDKRAVARGATLFANVQMKQYNNVQSLQCANCHGVDGAGGATNFILPPGDTGTDKPAQVSWKVPALNTVLLRFPEDQVKQIITYGRPGTPMPAWGVAGGGPKNDQAIDDLVSYIKSIQLPEKDAMNITSWQIAGTAPSDAQISATKDKKTQKQLSAQQDATLNAWNVPSAQKAVSDAQDALTQAKQTLASATTPSAVSSAQTAVSTAQGAVTSTQAWLTQVQSMGEGQLLFLNNCARCHTKGWSYFDPTIPDNPKPGKQGGGAFGPNLTGGSELSQFPNEQDQIDFITNGSIFEKAYGSRGIGSGRMPGFAKLMTKEQIQAVVQYERGL